MMNSDRKRALRILELHRFKQHLEVRPALAALKERLVADACCPLRGRKGFRTACIPIPLRHGGVMELEVLFWTDCFRRLERRLGVRFASSDKGLASWLVPLASR